MQLNKRQALPMPCPDRSPLARFVSHTLDGINSFFICILKWHMHSNAQTHDMSQSSRDGTPAGITELPSVIFCNDC